MTAPTANAAGDASIARPRPSRRGTADIPFRFPDRGLAQALAAERSEPGWLRAERLAAFKAYDALPVEANRLYTPYVDLRPAELMEVRPYVRTEKVPVGADRGPSRDGRPDRAARGRRCCAVAVARGDRGRGDPRDVRRPRSSATRPVSGRSSRVAGPSRSTTSSPSSPGASGARASGSWCRPGSTWTDPSSFGGRSGPQVGALVSRTLVRLGEGRPRRSSKSSSGLARRSTAPRASLSPSRSSAAPSRSSSSGPRACRSRRSRTCRPGSSPSSIAMQRSAPRRPSTGRSPSSGDDWSGRGSTTGSTATAPRSSRSRSCSARATRSST